MNSYVRDFLDFSAFISFWDLLFLLFGTLFYNPADSKDIHSLNPIDVYLSLQIMSKRCIILVFWDLFNLGIICVNSILEICKHQRELFIGQALCFVCGCSMHCEHVEETKSFSEVLRSEMPRIPECRQGMGWNTKEFITQPGEFQIIHSLRSLESEFKFDFSFS